MCQAIHPIHTNGKLHPFSHIVRQSFLYRIAYNLILVADTCQRHLVQLTKMEWARIELDKIQPLIKCSTVTGGRAGVYTAETVRGLREDGRQ